MSQKSFEQFKGSKDYVISDALKNAVNVAIVLQRPLLVRGEPGTGKTLLSHSIASSLNKELIRWNIKSTTKAAEGLYVYDTVQRLNDSRFGDKDVSDIKHYIKLGKLGQAFTAPEQPVLLIDEIDKADLEFPNDLLHELDTMEFSILETGDRHKARQRPVVVITSNSEKELPDAFLRRCVFHFIEFPDEELMARIVRVHHPGLGQKLLSQCLQKFYWIRSLPDVRKRPSTSELIDWIGALLAAGVSEREIGENIPFLGTLIKRREDQEAVERGERPGARREAWR